MKKLFLILIFVLICIILFFSLKDRNDTIDFMKDKIDQCNNLKTPSKCLNVICPETLKIYEPQVIYQEVVKRDCPECPVCEGQKECNEWKSRAKIFDDANMELLRQIKDLKDFIKQKCINFDGLGL